MDSNKDIKPLKRQFDFADVPSWYVLCTNNLCPMQTSCLRFLMVCTLHQQSVSHADQLSAIPGSAERTRQSGTRYLCDAQDTKRWSMPLV